jgi:2'-5' RNA ligase
MRLFIALELPDLVKAELAAAQGRLRAGGHPVRWADAAGVHLTLQFLGEADPGLVGPLLAGLAAIPAAPIALRLDGLGAFPSARQPRVVWAGVAGDTAALARLHAAVTAATGPLGFPAEARPFSPHLTLGRARQDARPEQLRALGEALRAAAPPAPAAWDAGPPTLFRSELTPRGAIYTALGM